jgi:hypothetical protein
VSSRPQSTTRPVPHSQRERWDTASSRSSTLVFRTIGCPPEAEDLSGSRTYRTGSRGAVGITSDS